jgi:hypothetical protein
MVGCYEKHGWLWWICYNCIVLLIYLLQVKFIHQTPIYWLEIIPIRFLRWMYVSYLICLRLERSSKDTNANNQAYKLDGTFVRFPEDLLKTSTENPISNNAVKLVVFSFKHYGFSLLRSWVDPFLEKYGKDAIHIESNYANHFISYYLLFVVFFYRKSGSNGNMLYRVFLSLYSESSICK